MMVQTHPTFHYYKEPPITYTLMFSLQYALNLQHFIRSVYFVAILIPTFSCQSPHHYSLHICFAAFMLLVISCIMYRYVVLREM